MKNPLGAENDDAAKPAWPLLKLNGKCLDTILQIYACEYMARPAAGMSATKIVPVFDSVM
jgi:hypothetical protein